ncbi:hypothetical protein GD605_14895 [Desulfolutivibrio sulfoxidireducens]|nr:hypothetical protein GD605_14895 [Desulfolutivibrio sulfoxidireducens]
MTCYPVPMEWIFFIAAGVVLLTLTVLAALKGNSPGKQNVPGQFDFDLYKGRELSRRGLHDRTKRG